jgi:hypothetical protein
MKLVIGDVINDTCIVWPMFFSQLVAFNKGHSSHCHTIVTFPSRCEIMKEPLIALISEVGIALALGLRPLFDPSGTEVLLFITTS